jgi:DNA polymerase elongation subunit (family B)
MKAWLMDAYRRGNSIVLWIKTPEDDLRIEKKFRDYIFLEKCPEANQFLRRYGLTSYEQKRRNFLRKWIDVYSLPVPNIARYESFVRWVERETNYRVSLYNADIPPEQMFLYKNNLAPCSTISMEDDSINLIEDEPIPLISVEIKVIHEEKISAIVVDNRVLEGTEREILESFVRVFEAKNPDVMQVEHAFSMLPYLASRLEYNGLKCSFHRWDDEPIAYKGGKSFFSYGRVRFQDFSLRLHGRFLIDANSVFGSECAAEAISELSQLTGLCFQQLAARSFGAAFQGALVREMIRSSILVPFKDKPVDNPISMADMVKADRAGHTFDPLVGFHRNVASIDFCSMFPWLIYNHNIGADTILSDEGPFENAPGVPVKISLVRKSLIARTIKPLIDRRMKYKRNPTSVNKLKAVGLKWVLVTSYGYLRFREFKLGIATSHAAICAYARETLIGAGHLAEEKGYLLVHGIVDSLFIKKKGINDADVKELCRDLEAETGVPASFEGIFKWVVFLPSINDPKRPIPARYFGVYSNGTIKARGIEVRQKSCPQVVKYFQQKCLEIMALCSTKEEIKLKFPGMKKLLFAFLKELGNFSPEDLAQNVCLGKENYARNIPQKAVVELLRRKNIEAKPGMPVSYVFSSKGIRLAGEKVKPDEAHYRRLLERALYSIMQPFGITKEQISSQTRQTRLLEHITIKYS